MDLKEGKIAVELARRAAENFLSGKVQKPERLPQVFYENHGAFVTLHTYPERELRGCIGYPEPGFPLHKALTDCAIHACQDPRFSPVRRSELSKIVVEASIIMRSEVIRCPDPKEYPNNITIGRDGLIIKKGFKSGLLLPQVAMEQNLSPEQFLDQTCMKAGLNPKAWMERDCVICRFEAEVFGEKTPGGKVEKAGK